MKTSRPRFARPDPSDFRLVPPVWIPLSERPDDLVASENDPFLFRAGGIDRIRPIELRTLGSWEQLTPLGRALSTSDSLHDVVEVSLGSVISVHGRDYRVEESPARIVLASRGWPEYPDHDSRLWCLSRVPAQGGPLDSEQALFQDSRLPPDSVVRLLDECCKRAWSWAAEIAGRKEALLDADLYSPHLVG